MSQSSNDQGRQRRVTKNSYTSRSGKTIKLNRSLSDRLRANQQARAARKATYLSTLPKNPVKRMLYRMHPKRLAQYWFSREGLIMGLKIIGIGIVVVFVLTIGVFAYFRKDLPKIKDISGDNLGGSISYYDSTGKTLLWQDYDAVKRIPVDSDQISKYIKEGTVAIEDKNFYTEGAFDPTGIIRAGLHDVFGGGGLQGASTITQQLVKLNEQWTDNRTFTRKIKELILAVELSREYSKDDILTGYLNIAPYGGVEYGAEAAARDYFHTDAANLTLAQAAMLAAIPQNPSYYSPYSSPDYNKDATANYFDRQGLLNRQHAVLDAMVEQHMISQKDADAAKAVDILSQVYPLSSKYNGIKAPYFVLAAKQELEQKYGAETVQRGGWKIITTLNVDLQNEAESLIATNLTKIQSLTRHAADEEALVAEDVQTGQIVSLVGGVDFTNPDYGQNNYAASVLIPPGSSFKPYDYSTFIDNNKNVGAGSVIYDSEDPLPGNYPCTVKGLPPPQGNSNCLQDYDHNFPGPVTLRYALGGSRNVPAVKAMLSAVPGDTSTANVASINKTIKTAEAMMDNPYNPNSYNCYADEQQTQPTQCYGSSAMGDSAYLYLDDHVNGLSTLARLGVAIPRTFILQIDDSSGKSIYQWQQPQGTQVINKDTAYILDDMASDPRASYLPGSCTATSCTPLSSFGYKFHRYNGWHFAIKTGTTGAGFDGLMTSWSTKYAIVTWVGNHTRNVPLNATMETLTEPLVRGWMEYAHRGLTAVNWQEPSDIKTLPAYVLSNKISRNGEQIPSPSTDIFPSWYQAPNNSNNASQTIDKVSGKAATSCTPDDAKETQTNSNATIFSVDKFHGGGATSSSSGNDDVHNCSDSPPTITLTVPPGGTCKSSDNGGTGCTITFTVTQGTHLLTDPQYPQFPGTVTISVNGTVLQTFQVSDSPSSGSAVYLPTSSGSVTVTANVTDSVLYQNSDQKTMTTVLSPSSP